jgi:hypothetical protein
MTHQPHNIPWNLLASNLQRISESGSTCSCKVTNLHPRMKPAQGTEITYFANAFAKNIKEHSKCERRKYPKSYTKPAPTDIIIDKATATLIPPTIRPVAQMLETIDRKRHPGSHPTAPRSSPRNDKLPHSGAIQIPHAITSSSCTTIASSIFKFRGFTPLRRDVSHPACMWPP